MNQNKVNPIPDPTRGNTRLVWEPTYVWTVNFFKEHPELKVGAEIGVAGGQHIKALIENTSIEKIYGIDSYANETWDMHGLFDINAEYGGFDNLYCEVKDMLDVYGEQVKLIRKTSVEASLDFEPESLDFVFIDASHTYEDCLTDIKMWHTKVRKGGYVMGHDWEHVNHPGVQKAVTEYYGDSITGTSEPVHVWYTQV